MRHDLGRSISTEEALVTATDKDLSRLGRKLAQISDAATSSSLAHAIDDQFGCDITVPIRPAIDSDQVAQLEADHGIVLPEEYRRFVTVVADGGLGPFYGMMSLQTSLAHAAAPTEPFRPGDRLWPIPGVLPLCDYGCGMTSLLVLNGESRGEVWMDDPSTDTVQPWWRFHMLHGPIAELYAPADASMEREREYRFLDWYGEWATIMASAVESY